MVEQDSGLTLTRLLQIARRNWLVVAILTVLGAAGAYAISASETPIYEASSSVYFSLRQGDTSSDLNQGSAYTQAQMLSFAQLATSSITLDRVINDLGLDISSKNLARNIDVTIPQNTVILGITVSAPSPSRAARIANSVASNLAHVVVELAPTAKDADAAVSARVIQPAVAPKSQSSPSKPRDTLLGALLGLLIGAVGSVLFATLDTRVRSAEALAAVTPISLLGQITRFRKTTDSRPVMVRDPNGEEAESFRRVRAGLRFAAVDKDVRVILVTSGIPGEGKTTLSVNLSIAMAETGAHVLLIDADFRRPRVAKTLGLEGAVGLTSVLVGGVDLTDARRPYGSTSLDLLFSGDVPPNPSELLSSARMAQVLAELSAQYDVVIVDTAPVLAVPDAALLSPHVDLTLLVVDSTKMRKAQVARSIRSLEAAGARVSGIVLNRLKLSTRRQTYYYDSPVESQKDESRLAKLVGKARGGSRTTPGTVSVPPQPSAKPRKSPVAPKTPTPAVRRLPAEPRAAKDSVNLLEFGTTPTPAVPKTRSTPAKPRATKTPTPSATTATARTVQPRTAVTPRATTTSPKTAKERQGTGE